MEWKFKKNTNLLCFCNYSGNSSLQRMFRKLTAWGGENFYHFRFLVVLKNNQTFLKEFFKNKNDKNIYKTRAFQIAFEIAGSFLRPPYFDPGTNYPLLSWKLRQKSFLHTVN